MFVILGSKYTHPELEALPKGARRLSAVGLPAEVRLDYAAVKGRPSLMLVHGAPEMLSGSSL